MKMNRIGILLASTLLTSQVWAQVPNGPSPYTPNGGGIGGGGGGGSGTVTSVAAGCANVATPSPITTSGTIAALELVNAQTGTSYTINNADCGQLTTFNNGSAVNVTLPQANTSSQFVSGWFADYTNYGAGTATINPTTSKINNGASSYALAQGASVRVVSDGTDYQVTAKGSAGASGITIGTTTITGGTDTRILRNNAGVVGEYTISGTGTVVAMATSPSFTTPTLGAATATTVTIGAGSAITSSGAGGALGTNAFTSTAYAPLASPTFTGTVTMPDASTWNSTNLTLTPVGSTTNPTIAFTGCGSNCGILAPAANQLEIVVGGTNRLDYGVTVAGKWSSNTQFNINANINIEGTINTLTLRNESTSISSPAANTVQFGSINAGAATAQNITFNSAAGANLDGAATTIKCGGFSTGNKQSSGDCIFQVGVFPNSSGATPASPTTALTLKGETLSVVLNTAAIATNATDGFLYIASGAGTPTGTPTTFTGRVPIYIDTTNSQLWLFLGGAWKQPKTPAAAALVTWQ